MTNIDGNTAAINRKLREEDNLAAQEQQLEEAVEKLADDLFEAYFDDNSAVVDEVFDSIVNTDDIVTPLLDDLRANFTQDGYAMRTVYRKRIAQACEAIAGRCQDMEKVERYYREFGL